MLEISNHAVARFRQRLRRLSPAACRDLIRAAVTSPLATKRLDQDGGRACRYGAIVEGLAIVVTVDERQPDRRVAVTVRPARCGSSGAGRGRDYRAERFVWERESWTKCGVSQ